MERGRASWARYPEIFKSEPLFRTKKEAWELFRIGPSYEIGGKARGVRRRAIPDRGVRSVRQADHAALGRPMTLRLRRPMTRSCRKYAPCIIVVHSQGGNFGFTTALNAPDKVKALIALEPSGAPDPAKADAAKLEERAASDRLGRFHRPASRSGRASLVNPNQIGPGDRGCGRQSRYVRAAQDRDQRQYPHDDDGPQLGRRRQAGQRLDRKAGAGELSVFQKQHHLPTRSGRLCFPQTALRTAGPHVYSTRKLTHAPVFFPT